MDRRAHAQAAMGGFAGVYAVPDPVAALHRMGLEPAWREGSVAFGGAPVWTDTAEMVVVSGDVTLDNVAALRRDLGLPNAEPGVLLAELFARHGTGAGRCALGMFAVAVWDRRSQRLFLMRDATGARTLYHAGGSQGWWFAARLRTLRRSPAVSGAISLPALRDYLACAFVPGAQTLWRDAHELRPGTALSLPDEAVTCYWAPVEDAEQSDEPLEAHAARLRPLLEAAVDACLPASGPVAVYLSGGLDSSLVTALAARAAPGPVHTFAIHFGAAYPNELPYSNQVASHCGTRHHVIELPARLIEEALPATMAALDDPIGDPLTVPNLLLGRAAAEVAGVALNGEGGDPCFGGPKNGPMLLYEVYGTSNEQRATSNEQGVRAYGSGGSREAAYLRSFQKCYDDLPRLLTAEAQAALRDQPPAEAWLAPYFDGSAMRRYVNQLMHVNVRFKGADHILTKVNNLTAANGVLGRSPLFDRRIVEASFAIPPRAKLDGAVEKAVLKRAVAELLPEAILTRPKSGMLVPVQAWMRHDLNRYARAMLLKRDARIRPYIDQRLVRSWLDYRGELWPRYGVKLWLILTLEVWLRAQEHLSP